MLYITSKTEHFSFKSGCVIRVAKRLQEDCFIVLYIRSSNCNFVPLLKCFIADVLKCKARLKVKFKCISITMYYLVMSSFSRDLIKRK